MLTMLIRVLLLALALFGFEIHLLKLQAIMTQVSGSLPFFPLFTEYDTNTPFLDHIFVNWHDLLTHHVIMFEQKKVVFHSVALTRRAYEHT